MPFSQEILDRYVNAIARLAAANGVEHRPATALELSQLSALGFDTNVLWLFESAVLSEMVDVGVRVHSPDDIILENTDCVPGADIRAAGLPFPVIGSTFMGDVLVLDYHSPRGPDGSPPVRLVIHDAGCDEMTAEEVVAQTEHVASSLIEFLEAAADGKLDYS